MGSSGHGEGQSGTFPSSGTELLCQLPCLLQTQPTSTTLKAPVQLPSKTPEGLCWSKAFEVFSSRPACNARFVLTTKAEQPRAYPGAKASQVDFPSRREGSRARREELRVLEPALRTTS